MSTSSLRIRSLHVDRLYGIPHDGLTADDLADGVNVIYGPNGKGKTTLGRAVHALLWPDSVAGYNPVLHGHLALGDDDWRVELEAGSVRYQRGGVAEQTPPLLPERAHRPRYVLSLHELVGSDGRPFAEAIRRDAAGGMDVADAADALGFTASTPRSGNATRDAKAAWAKLEEVRRQQRDLEQEAARLDALEAQRARAVAAQDEQALYLLAREHAAARDAAAEATRALDALPDALANVREDDAETLQALRTKVENAEKEHARAEATAADARERLGENLVASAGRPTNPVTEVEEHLHALQTLEDRQARKREEVALLRATENEAWRAIEGAMDEDRAAAVNADAVQGLETLANKALRLQGEEAAAQALARAAESLASPDEAPGDLEAVEQGVRYLREWLRAPRTAATPSLRPLTLAGAGTAGVLGLALGLAWHPAAFLLVAAALFLAFVATRLPTESSSDTTNTRERFERLGLGTPSWTGEGVEARLDELERARAALKVAVAAHAQLKARRPDAQRLDALRREVEAERARIAEALGIAVRAAPIDLPYTVKSLQQWQAARRARLGAEAALADIKRQIEERRGKAQTLLDPFGLPPADDTAALADRIGTLRAAYEACAEADRDLCEAEDDARRAEAEADEARTDIARLFARVGYSEEEGDAAVAKACVERAEYDECAAAASAAVTRRDDALGRLRAHAGFHDDLLECSEHEATDLEADATERAAERDRLTKEITRLEEQIHQARNGHQLGDAAARHRAALDDLATERDRAAAARVGHLLADRIARVARERQLPPVLRRARELFGAITKHRYELSFDPHDDAFVALDTVRGRGFRLDELSSGTRVQLLLSVRVAFVEQQELGARLPLVLDEVLANSDEERAGAIAEAVFHLCREGRQVFYFTAQPNEVAKWKRLAEEHGDVSCCFVALDGARPVSDIDPEALPPSVFGETAPPPAGRTHAAYGAALGVPAWDGWRPVDDLHLWYAIDDPGPLHAALALGFNQVGPLRSVARNGRTEAVGLDPETVDRSLVLADALEAWQEAWRIGRGLRVERDTLEACDAISDTFIDRVADYNESVSGDGRALVDGLRSGEVKRFHSKQADELEVFLQDHGYIDDEARLSEDAIWAQVIGKVGSACTAGAVDLADVRAFLARVTDGPPPVR